MSLVNAETGELLAECLRSLTPAPHRRQRRTAPELVYFMQAGDGGMIKIGCATDVAARMRTLQTGCPDDLILLGTCRGGEMQERMMHRAFANLRYRGEWFYPRPELLDFIGWCAS